MTWGDVVIIILGAMGFLVLFTLGRRLETKLDAALNLVRGLTQPKAVMGLVNPKFAPAPPSEERTVFHLTPEHDAKVLGEDDLD
jgi:hypothetical protein